MKAERDRRTGGEEKKERAERMTAVGEVRAEPFTARKTNRRDERSQARCLGRSLPRAISFIEQAFCDYHRAGIYFRIVLLTFYSSSTIRSRRITRRELIWQEDGDSNVVVH